MKKHFLLALPLLSLFIFLTTSNTIAAQTSIETSQIFAILKIYDVSDQIEYTNHPFSYTLNITAPANITENTIPLHILTEYLGTRKSNALDIEISHEGPRIDNNKDSVFFGATGTVHVPPLSPDDDDTHNDNIDTIWHSPHMIDNTLPQYSSGYTFGPGDHKIKFSIVPHNSNNGITNQNSIILASQTISLQISPDISITSLQNLDEIYAYPNPIDNEVHFNIPESALLTDNTDVVFTLYNNNGVIVDRKEYAYQKNVEIVYRNDQLSANTYHYTLTSKDNSFSKQGTLIKK